MSTEQRKYIRTRSGFVIWSDMTPVYHKHMARLINEEVISAGFCRFYPNEQVSCYGRSESLEIASLPEDSGLLQIWLYS